MPDLENVRKRLEAMAAPAAFKDGFHYGMRDNHNAIELEFGQMLYGAVLERKPEFVAELGTGPGYSASWIAMALEKNGQGYLWTLDPAAPQPPVWEQVGLQCPRLLYMNEVSSDGLEWLPKRIDMLFHDASHDFKKIYQDLVALIPRMPIGGFICVHDVNYRRNMGDLMAEWFDSMADQWDYQEVSSGCGIGIAKRKAIAEGDYGQYPRER